MKNIFLFLLKAPAPIQGIVLLLIIIPLSFLVIPFLISLLPIFIILGLLYLFYVITHMKDEDIANNRKIKYIKEALDKIQKYFEWLKKYIQRPARSKRENKVYSIVKEIFPEYKIHRNYTPYWLEVYPNKQLELDIFIEELKIGIEYQGRQHYMPVEKFGGKKGFKKQQRNDQLKKDLCHENGVTLVYFGYKEPITRERVEKRLKPHTK